MKDIEKRLTELEIRFTYQDHLIEELNEVIIRQQKEITQLRSLWQKLEEGKFGGIDQGIKSLSEEVPPPHY